ncbi:MAG: hypothetical protein PHR06_01630 [Candidatus Cloacimonetes bacterium]|nr:hypothetical protein [Candidatus Cloacimonadota bacterium]
MRRIIILILTLFSMNMLNAEKYAGEIFRMGAGVRNFALGRTGVSDYESPAIVYWNAALLQKAGNNSVSFMHSEEFDGMLKYDIVSAVWGNDNKLGLVVSRIGINDNPLTKLYDPSQPISESNMPYVYKTVDDSDYIVYFGISRKLADKLVLGITPKFAYRTLADESGYGFGADISTYFEFWEKSLLGLRLHDFFSTQIFWSTGTHEIVNPGLDLEHNLAFSLFSGKIPARLFTGIDLMFESREEAANVSLGQMSMDFRAGLELNILKYVDVYAGYNTEFLTSGLGLSIKNWIVQYAYEHNPELDNSHRVSLGYNWK